jgi:hypothetical protein
MLSEQRSTGGQVIPASSGRERIVDADFDAEFRGAVSAVKARAHEL